MIPIELNDIQTLQDEETFPAIFSPGQNREDRISAVHCLRFALGPDRGDLLAAAPVCLEVDHAGDRTSATLRRKPCRN